VNEAQILLLTAASIAFLHTVLGADHYVVFTAMGKALDWPLQKTLWVTFYCGVAHVLGSVVLGVIGLYFGAQLATLVQIEGMRGSLASWAMVAFGLMYFAWGLRQAGREHRHSHIHAHEGLVHDHEHDHHRAHAHVHRRDRTASITPWALFVIFVLGPCEALIPLFMYPAAQHNSELVLLVALVFSSITLVTMLGCVALTSIGVGKLKLPVPGRYAQAIAGASVVACGLAISMLGL